MYVDTYLITPIDVQLDGELVGGVDGQARIWLTIYGLVVLASVYYQSPLPLMRTCLIFNGLLFVVAHVFSPWFSLIVRRTSNNQ